MERAKRKYLHEDRKRQVKTTRLRYGNQHYETIGHMSSTFNDRSIAQKAALKRWHPEFFDHEGNLTQEGETYVSNNQKQ